MVSPRSRRKSLNLYKSPFSNDIYPSNESLIKIKSDSKDFSARFDLRFSQNGRTELAGRRGYGKERNNSQRNGDAGRLTGSQFLSGRFGYFDTNDNRGDLS